MRKYEFYFSCELIARARTIFFHTSTSGVIILDQSLKYFPNFNFVRRFSRVFMEKSEGVTRIGLKIPFFSRLNIIIRIELQKIHICQANE